MKKSDSPKNDWKDSLAAMMASMDSAPEEVAEPEPVEYGASGAETARLDIIYERKGRAGKPVTIVAGFTVDDGAVSDLASRLKKAIGTGGSARGGEILVQGDRCQEVLRLLTDWGYRARII